MHFFNKSKQHRIEQICIGAMIFAKAMDEKGKANSQNLFFLDASVFAGTSLMAMGLIPSLRDDIVEINNKYVAVFFNTLAFSALTLGSGYAFLNLNLQEAFYEAMTKSTGYAAASLVNHVVGW